MIEKIGKIEKTFLGYEDHGIFTASLEINYGGSFQSIGGYRLDEPNSVTGKAHGTAEGLDFITHVIKVAGVNKWEDVKGRTILVLFEDYSYNGLPIGIKNLPTEKGETFIFEDLWA